LIFEKISKSEVEMNSFALNQTNRCKKNKYVYIHMYKSNNNENYIIEISNYMGNVSINKEF